MYSFAKSSIKEYFKELDLFYKTQEKLKTNEIQFQALKNEIEAVYFTGQKSVKGTDIYSQVTGIIEGIYRMDTAEKVLYDHQDG